MNPAAQFAVLLRDDDRPSAEAIRRAFQCFQHLTDADAVRLAANAQGVLMRHLSADEARAFQHALGVEGVEAVVVNEQNLQFLPNSEVLNHIELQSEALVIRDYIGKQNLVRWDAIALVALAAVPHVEIGQTQTQRMGVRLHSVFGLWPKRTIETRSHLETRPHLILELVTVANKARYEVLAHQFPFQHLASAPPGTVTERFVWLARQFVQRASKALLNRAAQDVRDGVGLVRSYPSRQAMRDEMVWLLWKQQNRR